MINTTSQFKVYKKNPLAVIPIRADHGAAGYDLSSIEETIVPANGQKIIDTGLVFEFPADCYGRIAPRSGLAARNSIMVMAGVVDSSYRDSIKVILFNHNTRDLHINVGDRIAQIIFEKIYTPKEFEVVETFEQLSNTERGTGGFGSTGI